MLSTAHISNLKAHTKYTVQNVFCQALKNYFIYSRTLIQNPVIFFHKHNMDFLNKAVVR